MTYNQKYKILYNFIKIFFLSIFTFIFFFSFKNIINLWTYSEIHLNYSQGFIRRGFLGEIMIYLEEAGLQKKYFFSFIFYFFSIINTIIFLKIIKKITNNYWILIFLSLNPALLLFSFYDLGGYARFEIFGIFLTLAHSLISLKIFYYRYSYHKYISFYFLFFLPFFLISILIHEINTLSILFHIIMILNNLIFFKKKEVKIIIIFLVPFIFLFPIIYYFATYNISHEMLEKIYNNLKNNENVYLWIWDSIANPIGKRSLEFLYMIRPITNLFYYIFIIIFYSLPIVLLLILRSHIKYLIIILSILPFFLLFLIGRDWGRWIHLIILHSFLMNVIFLINKENKTISINNIFYKKKLKYLLIFLIIFQMFGTRIPHCCNLIEKNINLLGGITTKTIVFFQLINNKIDVNTRFKYF